MAITINQFTIDGSGVLTFYYTGSFLPGVDPTAGSIVDVSGFVAPNDFLNGQYTVTSVGGGGPVETWFKTTIVHAPAEGIRLSGTAEVEGVWPEPGPEDSPIDQIGEISMSSSVNASLTLIEVCFPDCAQKVLRGWGQVLVTAGGYITGGLPMGLINWLDARTVDFNGFLRCVVWDEEPVTTLYRYHYNPVTDTLQIFTPAGVELASGVTVPVVDTPIDVDKPVTQPETNLLMFEVSVDRTTVRG